MRTSQFRKSKVFTKPMQIASHKPIRISCQCVCRLVSPSRRDGDERVGPGCNRSKKQANPLAQAVSFIGRYLPIQKRLLTSLIICQGPVCFFHLVENHCKERKTKIEGGPILCSRSVGQCKRTSAVPSRTWEVGGVGRLVGGGLPASHRTAQLGFGPRPAHSRFQL